MPTLKQRRAVEKMLANPGKSKKSVLREVGYSEGIAKNPQDVFESAGFKEEAEPFVKQMEKERQRLMDSMKTKHLDDVGYRDHVAALDTLTKNMQLLTGKDTQKIGLNTTRLEEIEKALDDME